MSAELFEDSVRALNALVAAAEAIETPTMPDVPDWDKSPDSLDCIGDETRTPEQLLTIGREWQELACKLNDLLEEATAPDAWGDFENVVADLRAKAKAARLALIQIDVYDPPVPGSP